jgi:acyl transferase domain-containing protein/NAD(P)H-dependent flavin oxidoreductase YrpB (nitropropane dioxygenase family)/NAD(P)-dependent dehydrogenase (short-subunit alcohol dehydrogenase family)
MFSDFEFVAVNLPGLVDPSIAIAAARAGAHGVLNLEYASDEIVAVRALAMLDHYAPRKYGITLGANSAPFVDAVSAAMSDKAGVIILADAAVMDPRQWINKFHRARRKVLVQVTSVDAVQQAVDLGADGIVAKGHEAGGCVGDETSFVLLQHVLTATRLPVWVHGGIGLHTAAACYQAGAAGVVLDTQLALCRESSLSGPARACLARMDGSETVCFGADLGYSCRVYYRRDMPAVNELSRVAQARLAESMAASSGASASGISNDEVWREAIRNRVGWGRPDQHVWLLGQDGAFATPLATKFGTVAGVIEAMRKSAATSIRAAREHKPLDEGSALALAHGTRYPVVAGPMTRVSDQAAFAWEIAQAGALPFLALALMRADDASVLLQETKTALGTLRWGVGILGFVPSELREEQLEVILSHQPNFALIAGGRPDQAIALERAGIPTYIHVPSPALLTMFLESGIRRFVFEGRECGGHVGPRSSFVLWDSMVDALLERLSPADLAQCQVLFAGGIHDSVSAAMVSTVAAPLAERGAAIGVAVGTAYLFTTEAVATGAITAGFQRAAVACERTSLLESGIGHETRCARTGFIQVFARERRRLLAEQRTAEEIRTALEELNLGRLRIATKGIARDPNHGRDPRAAKLIDVSEQQQREQGMYMIGQVASLRTGTCSIAELHRDISIRGTARLLDRGQTNSGPDVQDRPCDIAIVGMSCILPKAPNLAAYWANIVGKVDAISEIPVERWDWKRYFDANPRAPDRIYSRWGGFIDDVAFDPTLYGIPPNALHSIEPLQLLTLEVVREALADAGYAQRPFLRERTAVILGVGGGVADLGQRYAVRSGLPMFIETIPPDVLAKLPEWTEESFPGILLNVAAGRVANRFDLGGVNYTVDAACASSLAAVYLATRELEAGTSDMVIVGGADTVQNPFGYMCFSKTHALSPRGRCHTFDENADGIAISEGLAVLILKRLADAERDGDRIHAVIKGVGGSSDGRDKSLTAPSPEGQTRALERAYAKAGISPSTITLVEAHGTGTVAGDQAEVATLKRVFSAAGAGRQTCALGSVKSMIGHTKCTAGVAGMVKAALALRHKVLPPTINVDEPNTKAGFAQSPFYLNTQVRPWIHHRTDYPRRAAVSAFGFGGTNFHVVMEEYAAEFLPAQSDTPFPSELILVGGTSVAEVIGKVAGLGSQLAAGAAPTLADVAWTLWQQSRAAPLRLAIVADSLWDFGEKLAAARKALEATPSRVADPRGIYFTDHPDRAARAAFLFPGQGSQRVDMLSDLCVHFGEVRERFEVADRTLSEQFPEGLSRHVFPPPRFVPEESAAYERTLTRTEIAQPCIGAASMGLFKLLEAFAVKPDFLAGHSYGEYVALSCAGVFSEEKLYELSEARGRCIVSAIDDEAGTMAAVTESSVRVGEVIVGIDSVWVANVNAPRQTVISGTTKGIAQALERLAARGIQARQIPVACAFHSPLVARARDRFQEILATVRFKSPAFPVFGNASAQPYPNECGAIAAQLIQHLVSPVQFQAQVETMYEAGARIFIEVGPRNVLTGLTEQILDGKPHLAVALETPGRSGLTQLNHALGQLATHCAALDLDRLYSTRAVRLLNLDRIVQETPQISLPHASWVVNGGRARRIDEQPLSKGGPTADPHDNERADQRENIPDLPSPDNERAAPQGSATADVMSAPFVMLPEPLLVGVAAERACEKPPPLTAGASEYALDSVMVQFQRLMSQFLVTQQHVMASYLQSATDLSAVAARGAAAHLVSAAPPSIKKSEVHERPEREERTISLAEQSLVDTSIVKSPRAPAPVLDATRSNQQDHEDARQLVFDAIAQKTGYPKDVLRDTDDLESDLGISSIARIEILAILERRMGGGGFIVDSVGKIRTIRDLLEFVGSRQGGWRFRQEDARSEFLDKAVAADGIVQPVALQGLEPEPLPAETNGYAHPLSAITSAAAQMFPLEQNVAIAFAPPSEPTTPTLDNMVEYGAEMHADLARFLPALEVAETIDGPHALPLPRGVLVITDDGQGIAHALAADLHSHSLQVAVIRELGGGAEVQPELFEADFGSAESLIAALDAIRVRAGPIVGIIHMLPLKSGPGIGDLTVDAWRHRLRVEVKSLFHLAKGVAVDLSRIVGDERGCVVAVTATGDGSVQGGGSFPGHGGLAGLIKTMAVEWPHVRARLVDVEAGSDHYALVRQILEAISASQSDVECAWRHGRRTLTNLRRVPLRTYTPPRAALDSDTVLLITGGARGITAEIACELAMRFRPTLLLVGRSAMPGPESADTEGITDPKALKAVIVEQIRRGGRAVELPEVAAAYRRLCQDREIRTNIAKMARLGAVVRYFQVDVRDGDAFSALIDGLYETYGRIDGVVHGAGVIEDRLLADKDPASFDRVFDTKAISAFVLARKLRPESLKFLALFSSVSGRFGNAGQSDYAAANEVINKLAVQLDRQWPGRVVAINWGPWKSDGMVSPETMRRFQEIGVELIDPVAGRRAFVSELLHGRKGEAEVVLGEGPWPVVSAERDSSPDETLALLEGTRIRARVPGRIELECMLDPVRDLYLADHRLDGRPVLPAAIAIEFMAEIAKTGWPYREIIGVDDFRVFGGIILDKGPKQIILSARSGDAAITTDAQSRVDVIISDPDGERLAYKGAVILGAELPFSTPHDAQWLGPLDAFPLTIDAAYDRWLFHGPLLRGIVSVEGISSRGLRAILMASSPSRSIAHTTANLWLIDPVVVDCAFQLSILWARMHLDMTPLPARFGRLRRFASLGGSPIQCDLGLRTAAGGHVLETRITFTNLEGKLLATIDDMEFTCSHSLNRLARGAPIAVEAEAGLPA